MRRASVFALLAAAGCSGEISIAELPGALNDARCIYLERCGVVANRDHCLAVLAHIAIDDPSPEAAHDAGKLAYDPSRARDCIDAYGALPCDLTAQAADALAACDDILTGTLAEGDSCGFDRECESNNCVVAPCAMACCTGACGPAQPLPDIGEPCTALCAGDAYCGLDSTCHAPLPQGAACSDEPCARGLYCKGRTATTSGACTPYPHLGEPCETVCAEVNAVCLGTCVAAGVLGDACVSDAQCSSYYTCTAGQCALMPTRGMPCTRTCGDESWCNSDVCDAQKANGAACLRNDECLSHYCARTNATGSCADVPLCY